MRIDKFNQFTTESYGREDMKGKKCETCGEGTYQDESYMDDLKGILHCTNCDEKIQRYKSNEPIVSDTPTNSQKTMKQFVLTTTSESSDHYIYFIEHPEKPTQQELQKFLVEQGNDVEDGESYENIEKCVEIKDFKKI